MDNRAAATTPTRSLSPDPTITRSPWTADLHSSWRRSVLRSAERDLHDRRRVELSLPARRQRCRAKTRDAGNAAPVGSTSFEIEMVVAAPKAFGADNFSAFANRGGSD